MDIEYFKNFNLPIERQKQVLVWLSGLYGLLLGIISMFLIELRMGIESWLQLLMILFTVGLFVVACNSAVRRILHKKQNELAIGLKVWYTVLSVFLLLIASAVTLAIRI